jgi:DnaJ like chaperone protein
MSIWTRITAALSALAAGEPLSAVFDHLRSPPERSVGFTIAIIALGAKMAKADGTVTRDEVAAFRQIFVVPKDDEAAAARVFNLARQDVAGFDAYAGKIAAMFSREPAVLLDLLEGLFQISMADGHFHPQEDNFLAEVARIFGVEARAFRALRARFVQDAPRDPWDVLSLPHGASLEDARAAWKQAVRDCHPDRMIARGVPPEAVHLATRRLIAINAAWAEISGARVA